MKKIYYSDIETPVGPVWAAISHNGLMMLNFPCKEKRFLTEVALRSKIVPEYRPSKLDDLSLWLDDYFKGETHRFKEKLDLRGTAFQKKVWKTIQNVPYGKLISYGQIARNINNPKASRAVGNSVARNPLAIVIPCHRVISSSGGLGGFGGGLPRKRFLLKVEGVLSESEGEPEKSVDLQKFF